MSFLFQCRLHPAVRLLVSILCLQCCLWSSVKALSWAEALQMAVEAAQGRADIRRETERISSPAVPSPSQRWKVSWASSHNTRSLFTSVSFYSSRTTPLFDNCHHDESILTLHRCPPSTSLHTHLVLPLSFKALIQLIVQLKDFFQGPHFKVYPSLCNLSFPLALFVVCFSQCLIVDLNGI